MPAGQLYYEIDMHTHTYTREDSLFLALFFFLLLDRPIINESTYSPIGSCISNGLFFLLLRLLDNELLEGGGKNVWVVATGASKTQSNHVLHSLSLSFRLIEYRFFSLLFFSNYQSINTLLFFFSLSFSCALVFDSITFTFSFSY